MSYSEVPMEVLDAFDAVEGQRNAEWEKYKFECISNGIEPYVGPDLDMYEDHNYHPWAVLYEWAHEQRTRLDPEYVAGSQHAV